MNGFRLFRRIEVEQVFTPSTVAIVNYVERPELEGELHRHLTTPGLQLVLYGHSGSGKTTLITKVLRDLDLSKVTVRCTETTTFDQIVLSAFDSLNAYYTDTKSLKSSARISGSVRSEYLKIASQIGGELVTVETATDRRVVPVQLTAQRLSGFLGEAKCVLVIEDFHAIADTEKRKLAQNIKLFMDTAVEYEQVKIVCLGTVGTARELLLHDPNLTNRIAEVRVPPLNDEELRRIIVTGSRIIGMSLENSVQEKLIYYSNNIASVCHQLCLDICRNKGIKRRRWRRSVVVDQDFTRAVESYLKGVSDTFRMRYDKITAKAYAKRVLHAIVALEQEDFTADDVKNEMSSRTRRRSVKLSDINEWLAILQSTDYHETLRYDQNADRYSIYSPFFHAYLKMKFASEQRQIKEKKKQPAMALSVLGDAWPSHDEAMYQYLVTLNRVMAFTSQTQEGARYLRLTLSETKPKSTDSER